MWMCCLLACSTLVAQSTIGGIINTVYIPVTGINAVTNSLAVPTTAGLAVGDSVLIIQMKGASFNTTNTAAFGNLNAVNAAGRSEINIICEIQAGELVMERTLANTYNPSGAVQIVRIPTYTDVVINAELTAPDWNGTTGGVLIFAASGWVRMSAGINMNGKGFRGGWRYTNYPSSFCGCAQSTQYPDYFYASPHSRAADKGEGIGDSIPAMSFGRGKEINGGGGGNDHNTGGGGGANYGAGGNGGNSNSPSCVVGPYCRGLNPGVGGLSLSTTSLISTVENRLFLGGGGGAGHDNNTTGTGGADGGGMVIILADSLNMGASVIQARGNSVLTPSTSDGCGGGGAGGTVVLSVRAIRNYLGDIYVQGGNGGSDSWTTTPQGCKGPGGGGGGGVVWSSVPIPPSIVPNLNAGNNGVNCAGAAGATPGTVGGIMIGLPLQSNTSVFPACLLPVEYVFFKAELVGEDVALDWETATEQHNHRFEVQRSVDGQQFVTIGRVNSLSQGGEGRSYAWTDKEPVNGMNWYRIRQVDQNGASSLSEVRMVIAGGEDFQVGKVYPNPVGWGRDLNVDVFSATAMRGQLSVRDMTGRMVLTQEVGLVSGGNTVSLPTDGMEAGAYFLELRNEEGRSLFRRFVVSR